MTSNTKEEGIHMGCIWAAHFRGRSQEMTNKTGRKRDEEGVISE